MHAGPLQHLTLATEAVEILRDQPQVSAGIHLTLNSEWQHYKWGPVLGASRVPSLVDENGHFHAKFDMRTIGKDGRNSKGHRRGPRVAAQS